MRDYAGLTCIPLVLYNSIIRVKGDGQANDAPGNHAHGGGVCKYNAQQQATVISKPSFLIVE
jgi:hypothetical protein